MPNSPLEPEWEQLGIPVDDNAEPEDAGVAHNVAPDDLDES